MLGFLFGTVCLIGLVKVLRYGRACGGDYGHRSWSGYRAPWSGRRWFLRRLFERLETTPGQEKAIAQALEQFQGNRGLIREELRATREDLARAVASGMVDERALEETFARHDRLLAQLRVGLVESLKTATEALDDRQRKLAADLIEGGRMGGTHWGGPYRGGGVWA